jgi:hypothetical protein
MRLFSPLCERPFAIQFQENTYLHTFTIILNLSLPILKVPAVHGRGKNGKMFCGSSLNGINASDNLNEQEKYLLWKLYLVTTN